MPLDALQLRILKILKRQARTEKRLSKLVEVDQYALSSILNDLMLYGYVDTVHRRRMRIIRRTYFVITPAGLAALQRSLGTFDSIVEFVRQRAGIFAESIAHAHPALRMAYGTYKLLR